jgi:hypothetical protein
MDTLDNMDTIETGTIALVLLRLKVSQPHTWTENHQGIFRYCK